MAAAALLLALPFVARAADDDVVFPKFECWEPTGATTVRLTFGAENQQDTAAIPSANLFDPPFVVPPSTIDPGYNTRLFQVEVDVSAYPYVTWYLGTVAPYNALEVNTAALSPSQRCSPSAQSGCHQVTETTPEGVKPAVAVATCGAGEVVVSGEAACGSGPMISFGRTSDSTWQVSCRRPKGATATARCCPQ